MMEIKGMEMISHNTYMIFSEFRSKCYLNEDFSNKLKANPKLKDKIKKIVKLFRSEKMDKTIHDAFSKNGDNIDLLSNQYYKIDYIHLSRERECESNLAKDKMDFLKFLDALENNDDFKYNYLEEKLNRITTYEIDIQDEKVRAEYAHKFSILGIKWILLMSTLLNFNIDIVLNMNVIGDKYYTYKFNLDNISGMKDTLLIYSKNHRTEEKLIEESFKLLTKRTNINNDKYSSLNNLSTFMFLDQKIGVRDLDTDFSIRDYRNNLESELESIYSDGLDLTDCIINNKNIKDKSTKCCFLDLTLNTGVFKEKDEIELDSMNDSIDLDKFKEFILSKIPEISIRDNKYLFWNLVHANYYINNYEYYDKNIYKINIHKTSFFNDILKEILLRIMVEERKFICAYTIMNSDRKAAPKIFFIDPFEMNCDNRYSLYILRTSLKFTNEFNLRCNYVDYVSIEEKPKHIDINKAFILNYSLSDILKNVE